VQIIGGKENILSLEIQKKIKRSTIDNNELKAMRHLKERSFDLWFLLFEKSEKHGWPFKKLCDHFLDYSHSISLSLECKEVYKKWLQEFLFNQNLGHTKHEELLFHIILKEPNLDSSKKNSFERVAVGALPSQ